MKARRLRIVVQVEQDFEVQEVTGGWYMVPALMPIGEALRRAVENVALPCPGGKGEEVRRKN